MLLCGSIFSCNILTLNFHSWPVEVTKCLFLRFLFFIFECHIKLSFKTPNTGIKNHNAEMLMSCILLYSTPVTHFERAFYLGPIVIFATTIDCLILQHYHRNIPIKIYKFSGSPCVFLYNVTQISSLSGKDKVWPRFESVLLLVSSFCHDTCLFMASRFNI